MKLKTKDDLNKVPNIFLGYKCTSKFDYLAAGMVAMSKSLLYGAAGILITVAMIVGIILTKGGLLLVLLLGLAYLWIESRQK